MKSSIACAALALSLGALAVAVRGDEAAPAGAPPGPSAAYRITGPFTHENLSIYLIHGKDTFKGKPLLTLKEALDKKLVTVFETSNVNELAMENTSADEAVFVQSGDIVKGGRQDRTVAVDFICPAKSGRMAMNAFCVEHSRWSKRGGEDSDKFASSNENVSGKTLRLAAKYSPSGSAGDAQAAQVAQQVTVNGGSAAAVNLPARAQGAGNGNAAANQGAVQTQTAVNGNAAATQPLGAIENGQSIVWREVAANQGKLAHNISADVNANASPSSYQLTLENKKTQEAVDAYVKELLSTLQEKGNDDVIGYAFAINGKMNSADAYWSRDLFGRLWEKMLRSSVVEALAELQKDKAFEPPKTTAVTAMMADAEKGQTSDRTVTPRVHILTRETKETVLFETHDKQNADACVHWSYVAK